MPIIPNVLSFIWVGSPIPPHYAANVVNWARVNPSYDVHLWTEKETVSTTAQRLVTVYRDITPEDASEQITLETTSNGFLLSIASNNIHNFTISIDIITALTPLLDPAILHEELTEWKNYGQASDILRIWVIFHLGGIYMDLDTLSDGRIMPCDIEAPYGFLLCEKEYWGRRVLINAILAGQQRSPSLVMMARSLERTYRDEYNPISSGIRKFEKKGRDRLSRLKKAREIFNQPELFSSKLRQLAFDFFKHEFVLKTANRGRNIIRETLFDDDQIDTDELSFQHQSGYYPRVGNDGSWHN